PRTAARTQPGAGRGKRPPATVVICNHQDAIVARAQFEAAKLCPCSLVEPIIFPYAAVPTGTGSREIDLSAIVHHETSTVIIEFQPCIQNRRPAQSEQPGAVIQRVIHPSEFQRS